MVAVRETEANFFWQHSRRTKNTDMVPTNPLSSQSFLFLRAVVISSCFWARLSLLVLVFFSSALDLIGVPLQGRSAWNGRWLCWSPVERAEGSSRSQGFQTTIPHVENPSKVPQELFVVSTGPSLGGDTVTSLGCCLYIKVHIFVLFCLDKGHW